MILMILQVARLHTSTANRSKTVFGKHFQLNAHRLKKNWNRTKTIIISSNFPFFIFCIENRYFNDRHEDKQIAALQTIQLTVTILGKYC